VSIDYENPDFSALVDMAMDGRPGPLQHTLRLLSAKLHRPLTDADYPECVHKMFKAFSPFAQANGMPNPGRPSKDTDQERLRLAYQKWVNALVLDGYEEKLLLIQITKETGGRELIGKHPYPINDEPSEHAHQEIGDEFGVGPDAIKKRLKKARKKGTPS